MQLTEASRLARELMNEHGLGGWVFEWDRSVRRFGRCVPSRRKIQMSEYLVRLNDECHVRHTILHEIAHALAPGDHHGPQWRAKCRELGIGDDRLHVGANLVVPQGSWIGICPSCLNRSHKFRKPKGQRSCGKCNPHRFDSRYIVVWTNPGFDWRRTVTINVEELEDDAA